MPTPVTTIVVLMLENRSFDHMLGMRPNVDGLLNGGGIDPVHTNPADPSKPGSRIYAVTADAPYAVDPEDVYKEGKSTFGGPSHSLPSVTEQLCGDKNGPVPAVAPLNGFVKSYVDVLIHSAHRSKPSDDEIRLPMQVFGQGRLPVLWALADEFLVCDQWFSEVPGPTQSNRLYVHAGTSCGFAHNVWDRHFTGVPTIYDRLADAGKTWGVYYFDLKDTDSFPTIKAQVDKVQPFAKFFEAAQAGTLPSYSFLCPRYNDAPTGRASSQHAPADVRDGEDLIADVYEALRAGPKWGETLLIVTYDEHGGFYDHVVPPRAPPPDGFTSPTEDDRMQAAKSKRNQYLMAADYRFGFDRFGLRVPAILVSPRVEKGGVDSTQYSHTSILATLHELFGTQPLTARDRAAKSFVSKVGGPVRTDTPLKLPRPDRTEAESNEIAQEADLARPPTGPQNEMWPGLARLDGHPDTGKVTLPPRTRREAASYVAERVAANRAAHMKKAKGTTTKAAGAARAKKAKRAAKKPAKKRK
jgi:phospholipase C